MNNGIFTILGSGTSSGVPLIGCECAVCRSTHPQDQRTRASAWIQWQGKSLLIDTSTDLRQQALREKIKRVDAVLYTHPHADHIYGIDDLRAFNFVQKSSIPVYGHDWTIRDLQARFGYIFSGKAPEGGGVPQIELRALDPQAPSFCVEGIEGIPLLAQHGSDWVVGFRFKDLAYLTDCSSVPSETRSRMGGLETLILDCVRIRPHRTHFNLDQALALVEELKPKQTFLTHLGHELGVVEWGPRLPHGVSLAFDGLKIEF